MYESSVLEDFFTKLCTALLLILMLYTMIFVVVALLYFIQQTNLRMNLIPLSDPSWNPVELTDSQQELVARPGWAGAFWGRSVPVDVPDEPVVAALEPVVVSPEPVLQSALQKDTQMSKELEATAAIDALIAEVKECKSRIEELEKTPSESSMSSTVDISAEIAEQLQVCFLFCCFPCCYWYFLFIGEC